MQLYVNYYDREERKKEENHTIGILLCTDKKEDTVIKYTLPEDNENIFVSEYKLYLPTEEELKSIIEEEKKNIELNNDTDTI